MNRSVRGDISQVVGPDKAANYDQIRLESRLKNVVRCIQFETGFFTIVKVCFRTQSQILCTSAPFSRLF